MSEVAIAKGANPQEATIASLKLAVPNIQKIISQNRPVLIKPNYINSKKPSTGVTTDARVVEGIVQFLQSHGVDNIIIGYI